MKKLTIAATIAPVAGILMLGSAMAQDATATQDATTTQDVTMGDQTIPADQMSAVEDWCKELQAQQGLTGTQEPESTITEEQAEAATATQGEGEAETFDLSAVTLEQCQEAGFTDTEGD
jgi:hypothetical protein